MPTDHILEFSREQGKCGKKGKGNPLFHNGADMSGELHQHAAHVKFNTPPNAFR